MENMQANMDKRGMAKRLVQGSMHSKPEERKPEGVLQLSHNKPHSTCQQSLLKIIKGKIKLHYDREMVEEQAGFVEGNGTREQIVNIRIITEKCRDQHIPLYMCFIDYAKAFDCVSHMKLWDTMEQMGLPVHIIQLIANLYKEQESVVRTTNGDTDWFKIERGVRQGCVISSGLNNIYSKHIMRCVLEEHHDGITIGGRR